MSLDDLLHLNAGRQQPEPATNGAANPVGLASVSQNVKPITRPDQSMQTGGPVDQAAVNLRAARNATAPNSATSPAGQPIVGSGAGLP